MPQQAAKQRIEEEHAALRTALERLEATTDLRALVPQLQELGSMLESHFATEEADDGLHEAIGDESPALLPAVQRLFDEHREMLAQVASLTEKAWVLSQGPLAEVLTGIEDLTGKLRAHEARETELFGDAVYTDVGPQD